MIHIPIDIKLNILEYAGKGYILGVSDESLTERIKKYESSFDVSMWKNQVQIKKNLLGDPILSVFKDLYEYVTLFGISLRIMDINSSISVKANDMKDIARIASLLNKAGFKTEKIQRERIHDSIQEWSIFVEKGQIKKIQFYFILSWTLQKKRPHIGYNGSIFYAEKNGMKDLIPILDSLSTPLSLAGYLRYRIRRNREEVAIKRNTMYNSYTRLVPYPWTFSSGRNDSINSINFLYVPLRSLDLICPEYVSQSSTKSSRETLIILEAVSSNLIEIDRFYHPYVFYSVNEFK